MSDPVVDSILNQYFRRLELALARVPSERREQIVEEIREHVSEALAALPERSEIAETVLRSLEDVHRIGRELRPEALDDLGLINALIALCGRVDRQGGLRVRRDLDGHLPALSSEVELVIYRVVQEALTNALRHAHATEATVTLRRAEDDVVLVVSDDGRGIPESTRASGLDGMRERAMLIDAELEIHSGAGRGTEIVLAVPVVTEQRW